MFDVKAVPWSVLMAFGRPIWLSNSVANFETVSAVGADDSKKNFEIHVLPREYSFGFSNFRLVDPRSLVLVHLEAISLQFWWCNFLNMVHELSSYRLMCTGSSLLLAPELFCTGKGTICNRIWNTWPLATSVYSPAWLRLLLSSPALTLRTRPVLLLSPLVIWTDHLYKMSSFRCGFHWLNALALFQLVLAKLMVFLLFFVVLLQICL